jgi:bifunctional DNA-binding transcriptional regulator/antitoxin component of YhaV-PrlF toxin-antitoxin module
MEITTMSTKGQVVIPQVIRQEMPIGQSFSVTKINDLIVLKPVPNLSKEEVDELKELDQVWKTIAKSKKYSESEFFEKLKKW